MYKSPPKPKFPRRNGPAQLKPDLLLYVEDDDDNWEIAELRLSKGYELIRARNDEEACRLVRERRHEIDVILMDIELRGSILNGIELTQLLRGKPLPKHPTLPEYARSLPLLSKPVIFVTANGARHAGAQLILSGGSKIIPKPVNFLHLQTALAELLMERTLA